MFWDFRPLLCVIRLNPTLIAAGNGGALVLLDAAATIIDGIFDQNVASSYGGGLVQVYAGSLDVASTLFRSNTALQGGGAITAATTSRSDR